jgi:hypothetical protein
MSTAIIMAVSRATGIVMGAGITTETMAADEKGGLVPPFLFGRSAQPGLQSGITFETDCSAYVQLTGLNWY